MLFRISLLKYTTYTVFLAGTASEAYSVCRIRSFRCRISFRTSAPAEAFPLPTVFCIADSPGSGGGAIGRASRLPFQLQQCKSQENFCILRFVGCGSRKTSRGRKRARYYPQPDSSAERRRRKGPPKPFVVAFQSTNSDCKWLVGSFARVHGSSRIFRGVTVLYAFGKPGNSRAIGGFANVGRRACQQSSPFVALCTNVFSSVPRGSLPL